MGAVEFRQWLAYFMLKDEEYREKLEKRIALARSAEKSDEQRAEEIKRLLGFYK